MINHTRQQMTRLAAVIALALLCAQTLVVAHDHDPLDDGLCAVCSTSSGTAAAGTALPPPVTEASSVEYGSGSESAAPEQPYTQRLPRGPPTA